MSHCYFFLQFEKIAWRWTNLNLPHQQNCLMLYQIRMKKQSLNQYTIGKQLRKAKNLRKTDLNAKIIEPSEQLSQYINFLKDKGVVFSDLAVAQFKTKNGLPYTGLITTELFPTNKIFIRVPVNCLLNTRIAFHSDVKSMFQEHPQYFCKQFHHNWEDHILLAYILYEYSKGKDSDWYHLIRNLPRQIDYVIFWSQNEIKLLEDKVLEKMIRKSRQTYEKQTKQFMQIAKNYPHFYSKDILIQQNIRWIHIHLVTRCFGKYFQYTTMVPFAELINHECSDVYYTMYYDPSNPHDTKQEFYDQKVLTADQIDDIHTSDGSYNSEEYEDPDDNFEKVDCDIIGNFQDDSQQILKMVKNTYLAIFNSVNFGDNVSLGYLLQIHEAVDILRKSNQTQNYKKVELTRIQTGVSYYASKIKKNQTKLKFTKSYHNMTLEQKQVKEQQKSSVPITGAQYYPQIWQEDKFDQFLMLCSSKDQFEKHSQIFFCYGRLSNRMMLMRYGMTLQYNKYNHFYLHLPIQNYTQNYKIFPLLLKKYGLPTSKKIKVRRTKLCFELLTFLRCLEWRFNQNIQQIFAVSNLKTELRILKKATSLFKEQLSHFSVSLEHNQKSLLDSKVGYHEYFSLVYKLEKQRIIQSQIKLLNVAYEIVNRMLDGKTTLQTAMLHVPELQTSFEMRTNRLMMKEYFDNCFKKSTD